MKRTYKTRKNSPCLTALAVLGCMLLGVGSLAVAATPTLFLEQSTSITGASDTLKLSRVPVRNSAGSVKYYEIEFKLQLDAADIPVLVPSFPVVGLSPSLLSGAFKAGKYKDQLGNVFTVTGPGASTGGRTNWSILKTKPVDASTFEGFWTTGAIAGHPLEATLKAQGITSKVYSWGTVSVSSSFAGPLYACSNGQRAVGFVQIGSQLSLHGFCSGTAVETAKMTLSLCTTANPCP